MSTRIGRVGRRVASALGVLIILSGGGAALAATVGHAHGQTYVPSLGIGLSKGKLKALERSDPHFLHPVASTAAPGGRKVMPAVPGIPGRLLPPMRQTPFPPGLLQVTRAWQVSNGRTLVCVYPGANPASPAEGRIIIFRQNILAGTQSEAMINVSGSGALTIIHAPLGVSAEAAGGAGALTLRGANGAAITLHLRSDTVS
jgi:hypothetical protein